MTEPLDANQRPPLASLANRELLSELLADQRSPGTRKAYARDLRNFFQLIAQSDHPGVDRGVPDPQPFRGDLTGAEI